MFKIPFIRYRKDTAPLLQRSVGLMLFKEIITVYWIKITEPQILHNYFLFWESWQTHKYTVWAVPPCEMQFPWMRHKSDHGSHYEHSDV
jgi:hypothetical protein